MRRKLAHKKHTEKILLGPIHPQSSQPVVPAVKGKYLVPTNPRTRRPVVSAANVEKSGTPRSSPVPPTAID